MMDNHRPAADRGIAASSGSDCRLQKGESNKYTKIAGVLGQILRSLEEGVTWIFSFRFRWNFKWVAFRSKKFQMFEDRILY